MECEFSFIVAQDTGKLKVALDFSHDIKRNKAFPQWKGLVKCRQQRGSSCLNYYYGTLLPSALLLLLNLWFQEEG